MFLAYEPRHVNVLDLSPHYIGKIVSFTKMDAVIGYLFINQNHIVPGCTNQGDPYHCYKW